MSIDWEPLREIITNHERFVLSSHVRPDADALGSELGLAMLLERLGKKVRIVNPSGIPDNLEFLDPEQRIMKIGKDISIEEVLDTDVHIVVDTSAWVQLVEVGKALRKTKAKKVVIDHHVSSDDLGAVEFKDTTAEATGSLIVRLADAMGWELTPEMTTPLYCAIATDTGWFRFSSTTGSTMRIIGRLIDLGAKPHLIYQQLYERNSLARVLLAARVLAKTQLECDGRLAYLTVTQADFEATSAKPVDTEDLVNESLKIAGTEAAFIAIEQLNKTVKVSFRSRTTLNVAQIAEQFGGGGHKQAAGAVLPGPLNKAVSQILTAMKSALDE
ncbi:MAG: bifunctional oligoribonuclease/PAP phosphatase NrnA [Planctomycetaceae bacterium]|nr:bifunctional oligoribonuclease/PAP phosphatase NrnA [Planctomycetaceae bacterium]